ncbi:MAG TPA: hypothetical protein VHT73_12915 [Thermodesulfobacteriota bacterium]|nr:hypothetical protein [Thermodesulfobacteriota bacterium]
MTKEEMKYALERMAEEYEEKRTGLYLITTDRMSLEESLKKMEIGVAHEVSVETDNGKKVYTNEISRAAETQKRLSSYVSYLELRSAVDTLQKEEMKKKADVSILEYKLRVMECIVKLEVA